MGTGRPGEWAPGRTKSKTEREKGWENDSRKKARITEKQKGRETNGRESKERVRNLFEVESTIYYKASDVCVGFSAALELPFRECTETEFKFGSRTKQLSRGNKGLGPCRRGSDGRVW